MKIEVRLFATLREGRGKVLEMELEDGVSTRRVLDQLGIPESDVAILLIGGRDGELDRPLVDGNILSIFPPVGGG